MRPILFLAAVASLVAAAPSAADACSPPICWAGSFTPANGATVPANLPAMYWRPLSGYGASTADPSKVVLASAAAPSTPLPFTTTQLPDGAYLIVPKQPLTPGTAYVLTDQSTCGSSTTPLGPTATFQVAAAAPLPTSLGALAEGANLVGPLEVASAGGSCSAEVEAHQIRIDLQPTSETIAWRDALHFETLVDGEVWRAAATIGAVVPPGTSWRGRGVDLVYRVCKTSDDAVSEGLAAGPHEVVMRATLPGSSTVVSSSSLTVELACASDGPPVDEGGASGGCGAGRPRSSGWLLLGALAAAIGLRRRTARRCE